MPNQQTITDINAFAAGTSTKTQISFKARQSIETGRQEVCGGVTDLTAGSFYRAQACARAVANENSR